MDGLSLDEVKNFRQFGSRTAGHPERELIRGIEVTTGPLGQGLAMGVGLALAAKMKSALSSFRLRFSRCCIRCARTSPAR